MNETLVSSRDFARFYAAIAALPRIPAMRPLRVVLTYESMSAATWASDLLSQIKLRSRKMGPLKLETWGMALLNDGACRKEAALSAAAADLLVIAFGNCYGPYISPVARWLTGELASAAGHPKVILAICTNVEAAGGGDAPLTEIERYAESHGSTCFVASGTALDLFALDQRTRGGRMFSPRVDQACCFDFEAN